jgi:hypothetical protein
VDLLVETGRALLLVEAKSGATVDDDSFDGGREDLEWW